MGCKMKLRSKHKTKANAQKKAGNWRYKGYLARTKKLSKGWGVYACYDKYAY
jgi:hypothetical protein